jgi:hypothetical protein
MTGRLKGARDEQFTERRYPDLTPSGENISGRVVKNMRICGSGVYNYGWNEIPGLIDLKRNPMPDEYRGVWTFGVYRPANVLRENAHLFARLPITVTHPKPWVTLENGKEYTRGFTGDCVTAQDEEDGETYLYTTGTFFDREAVDFYEEYKALSCGYIPLLKWESGEYKGRPYHLVLYGIRDANHIALVSSARGGRDIKVLDSGNKLLEEIRRRGKRMKPLNLILSALGARDDASKIREVFNHAHSAEDIGQAVEFVTPYLAKALDCAAKSTLEGFLSDLKTLDESDKDVFVKCRNHTRDLAVKLVKGIKDGEDPPEKEKAADAESVDQKIERALDGLRGEFGKMLDERLGLCKAVDGAGVEGDQRAGDPTMRIDDKQGAREGSPSSAALMDILRGGK